MADLPPPAPLSSLEHRSVSPAAAAPTRNKRPLARGTASYPRKRAVKACQVCRARRTKCDNAKPSCSFCLKVGATCIQSPVDLSSFDPASLKILERLDDLEELLTYVPLADRAAARKTRVVDSPRVCQTDALQEPLGLECVIPQALEHVASWPVFAPFQGECETVQAPEVDPHTRPSIDASTPLMPILGGADLEPKRVNELLDNFFQYVHVKNPVLDEVNTRNTVMTTVINGVDWSPESCLALLVCALSSIATPFGSSHSTMPGTPAYNTAQSFFSAAQRRIGTALCADDTLAAQCLFLSGVYMMCTFQSMRAWRFFLQALAACQQFSFLHPSQQHRPASSDQQASPSSPRYTLDTLQQAIYWSSWKSEREMRGGDVGSRLPDFSPAHRDHDLGLYPPFFPTPPGPSPDTAGAPVNSRLARERTSWYFYLAEISLRRLSARVAAEMVGLRDEAVARGQTKVQFLAALAEVVPGFEEQAREWIASLPTCLSFDAPVEDDDVCRFVLRGHAINLYELIHWPFLAAYIDCLGRGDRSPESHPMPAHIAKLAQKALDYHFLRLVVNKPGYKHRHHGTIPMIRSCSRSALILVATAKLVRSRMAQAVASGMSDLYLPHGWAEEVDEVADVLAFWGSETQQFRRIHRVLTQAQESTRRASTGPVSPHEPT